MSHQAVKAAIVEVRARIQEWDAIGMNAWREEHTRYALIDPIITALGWNTAEPMECHPEWYYPGLEKRADYALFRPGDIVDIGTREVAPYIIIEAKALCEPLDNHLDQLDAYTKARPRMTEGYAVLTNGAEWRIFDPIGRRRLANRQIAVRNVVADNIDQAAQTLVQHLAKP